MHGLRVSYGARQMHGLPGTLAHRPLFAFVMIDAASAAAKWARNASAATQDYVEGAQRSDVDPTQRAIANKARALSGYQDAINSGRWEAALRASGRQGWLDGIATKGATNYANGVQQSEQKVAAAFGPLFNHISNLQRTVSAMPSNTDAERELRMLTFVRGMRQYRKPS